MLTECIRELQENSKNVETLIRFLLRDENKDIYTLFIAHHDLWGMRFNDEQAARLKPFVQDRNGITQMRWITHAQMYLLSDNPYPPHDYFRA